MKTLMELQEAEKLKKEIRSMLWVFIVVLALSGITAFPIETELNLLSTHLFTGTGTLSNWLHKVQDAVHNTNASYPFLAYGTDWLAFAHLVIAVAFIGPLRDPVRNIWIIQFGMIACVMIIPLALIAGPIRQIPFFHQLIDCSFGVLGILPLYYCYRKIKALESLILFQKQPAAIIN